MNVWGSVSSPKVEKKDSIGSDLVIHPSCFSPQIRGFFCKVLRHIVAFSAILTATVVRFMYQCQHVNGFIRVDSLVHPVGDGNKQDLS